MSRRSCTLKKKARQSRTWGLVPREVLIPNKVVRSTGRTMLKVPVRDRQTREIVDFRLEPGIPSTKVVTQPAYRDHPKWKEVRQ